jgi:hypothetical protein
MPPKSIHQILPQRKRRSTQGRNHRKRVAREQTATGLQRPCSKQEWQEKRVERNPHGLPSLEMLDLMHRTVTAFMGLPLRMARCRTPLDAWSEQAELLRNIVADCQSVGFRMMTGGFVRLPQTRPRTRRELRKGR